MNNISVEKINRKNSSLVHLQYKCLKCLRDLLAWILWNNVINRPNAIFNITSTVYSSFSIQVFKGKYLYILMSEK